MVLEPTFGMHATPNGFWWLPVDGQRHAIRGLDRGTEVGGTIHALCGGKFTMTTDGDWLYWRHCSTCYQRAKEWYR